MGNGDVLNAQAAAEMLGAHVETIRRLARRGAIPAFKVGKDWRFRKTALLEWSETNTGMKQQRCVLVIDDDAGVCRLVRRVLEPENLRVLSAASGSEGLSHIHKHSVDIVLLDLDMPVMNGPAVIGEMRKVGLEIPIIIITGYPDSTLMMEASRFGPLTLVPKPIEKKMLTAAVKMVMATVAGGITVG